MKGFKVRKAAQVAAFFAKAQGGSINVLKLVKLVYLADRLFMEKFDSPILNDRLVSMPHGPVNSMTLNYINGCEADRENWDSIITDRAGHRMALVNAALTVDDLDELSRAEIRVLQETWERYGPLNQFELRDYTHEYCPEWEDPQGSSADIPYERVFKYLGKKQFSELAQSVESERFVDRLLAVE